MRVVYMQCDLDSVAEMLMKKDPISHSKENNIKYVVAFSAWKLPNRCNLCKYKLSHELVKGAHVMGADKHTFKSQFLFFLAV